MPLLRTANEMYHLRDAAPVKKSELESGDLVFFRIRNRGTADHVGVYLGNGRFIQSPRTGRDIRISYQKGRERPFYRLSTSRHSAGLTAYAISSVRR
nr:NlpC/P60 family protein [Candidatus Sodalis sp. SoCistrobi]